jgi:hypothetical protein
VGKLGTLAIVAALGAWVPATFADPPETANPSAKTESTPQTAQAAEPGTAKPAEPVKRADPPAPPRQYLDAGARLFNERRYELAAKYLGAADRYRDRLTGSERIVLDHYLDYLDEYRRQVQMAPAPAAASVPPVADENHMDRGKVGIDVGIVPASTMNAVSQRVLRTQPSYPSLLGPQPQVLSARRALASGPIRARCTERHRGATVPRRKKKPGG